MSFKFRKPKRPVTRVFLHCSASDNPAHDNVATMDLWHKQRGWSGVGYHLFIRKSGLIELGRDLEKVPAAQEGHNTGSIAICCHGLARDKFTDEQMSALIGLCHQINEAYDGKVTFHGHCEVANKACPVYSYKAILGLRPGGVLPRSKEIALAVTLETPRLSEDSTLEEPPVSRQGSLRIGDKGGSVQELQKRLADLGYFSGKLDGIFGDRTRAAVLAFQADNHLVTDGVFSPASREALKQAKPRVIGEARASASIASLATDGSRIVRSSIGNSAAGVLVAGGGALKLLDDTSGVVTQLAGNFGVVGDAIGRFGPWIGAAVVLIGIYVVIQSVRSAQARVEDHRTGKTA